MFTTGSEGGYLRGTVDIIYTTEPEPIRVDTLEDVSDGDFSPGEQSLHEALFRAGQKNVPVDIPILVSGTISLEPGSITTSGTNPSQISLLALAGDLTLDAHSDSRILVVSAGHILSVFGINFLNGRADDGDGGAVFNNGSIALQDCYFKNNLSTGLGGGAISTREDAFTDLRSCFFESNRAQNGSTAVVGGSLLNFPNGNLTVINCVILNSNQAIANLGHCEIHHCTLYNGHRLLTCSSQATTIIGHTLVAGGPAHAINGGGADIFIQSGDFQSDGYNTIENPPENFDSSMTDIINQKDLGVRSGVGGGVVLMAFSPCVNNGDNTFNPSAFDPPLQRDILGNPRVAFGNIDIGAIEVKETTLLLLQALIQGHAGDNNHNGIQDLVDVLSGIDPTTDAANDPPAALLDIALGTPSANLSADAGASLVASPVTTLIESRIDERSTETSGTLQTSSDLINWTDRATYTPLGASYGYERTLPDGATFIEHEQAGFCWLIREEIIVPPGGRLFLRLMATQLP